MCARLWVRTRACAVEAAHLSVYADTCACSCRLAYMPVCVRVRIIYGCMSIILYS